MFSVSHAEVPSLSLSLSRISRKQMIAEKVHPTLDANSPNFADALEKLLFARAKSLSDYLSFDSLDDKLKLIMSALIDRKLSKAERKNKMNSRRYVLIEALGGVKKYEQVAALVNELKRLQSGQIVGRFLPTPVSSTITTGSKKEDASPRERQTTFTSQQLDPPVRALFFNARLVNAFDLTPAQELKDIFWEKIICEAEVIIEDFREWVSCP
jgi:hypothetical protein